VAITEERIKALDEVGFYWGSVTTTVKSFEQRMEQLKTYKETHGHVNVKVADDKNLNNFCTHMRIARRKPGIGMAITEERIKAMDELGFKWGSLVTTTKPQAKRFEQRSVSSD